MRKGVPWVITVSSRLKRQGEHWNSTPVLKHHRDRGRGGFSLKGDINEYLHYPIFNTNDCGEIGGWPGNTFFLVSLHSLNTEVAHAFHSTWRGSSTFGF